MSKAEQRNSEALLLISEYGGIDGAHHKQWVLDQVARALTGGKDDYRAWRIGCGDSWDEGIAP